ncbi:MAG: dihydroorotate dehydrogenase electron transfer subunit [Proteobacteria bacterium]|nr:dihydroorotate dehydrogenase electron transfer subunit [Pseudomonadota bacterium]
MSQPSADTDARSLPVRVDAEVLENRDEGGGNHHLCLRVPDWPGSAPGQFVMLSAGARSAVERTDPLLPRPMAVYRQSGSVVEVLYKVTGRGTALLAQVRPGQRVRTVGPLGCAFLRPDAAKPAILVGGGTGIASLHELAAQCAEAIEVTVLLGARTAEELMARDDFAALPVELRIATDDGSEGHPGVVTELLEEMLAEGGAPGVYACGPTPMMRRCAELARAAGARCQVSLENHMACGFGVCLGCAAPLAEGGFALVCTEGPVFDAARVAWETLP